MGKHYELPEAFSDYLAELVLRYRHRKAVEIIKTIREGDEIRPAADLTKGLAAGE